MTDSIEAVRLLASCRWRIEEERW